MEPSASGLAALTLFVLVLGYWVPQRVRHRQQLLDTRLDDRFSAGLRVLAVAARGPVPALASASIAPADDAARLLTMSGEHQPIKVPVPIRDSADHGAPYGSLGDGSARGGSRPPARPAGRRAREETPVASQPAGAPSRLAILEQRATRARRRLRLTVALLLLTAATWVAVLLTPLLWFAGLVPTLLLAVVLVLGRTASAAARRTDARWAAERRAAERRALQARALAAGGPRAPINRARITGRAVHGSTAMTQMIPKVTIRVVDGVAQAVPADADAGAPSSADPRTRPVSDDAAAGAARPGSAGRAPELAAGSGAGSAATTSARPESGSRAGAPSSSEALAPAAALAPTAVPDPHAGPTSSYAPGAAAKAIARPAAPTVAIPSQQTSRQAGHQTWEARPVPLPTYVTKPAAPRREPRPLTGTTPAASAAATSTGWSSTPWQRVEDTGEQVGEATTSWSLGETQDAALGTTATPAPASASSSAARGEVPASPAEGESFDPLVAEDPRPRTETLGLPLEQILARRRAAG